MTSKTHRAWCFTDNDKQAISRWAEALQKGEDNFWPDCVRFCIGQLEEGEQQLRKHIQGYVEFKVPRRLAWLKKNLSGTAHWEPRRGTREQARDYCRKPEGRLDGPWEYGDFGKGGAGRRNDLEAVAERVREGATIQQVADEFPIQFIKFNRGIREYQNLFSKKRDHEEPHEVHVFYGPPGCGKTSRVHTVWGSEPIFWKSAGEKWFDGYNGENVICYDDWNHGWFSIDLLCRVLDRYEVRVETKGGTVQLSNSISVITTNTLPRQWYNWDKHGGTTRLDALLRRVSKWHAWIDMNKSVEFEEFLEFYDFINDPSNMEFNKQN